MVSLNSILTLVAGLFCASLAVAAACRGRRSLATWCFSAGMVAFALENLFGTIWREALSPERAAFWGTLTLVTKSFVPGIWVCFSLTYSRGSARTPPARAWFLVLAALLIPVAMSLVFRDQLVPVSPYTEPGADWWVRSHAAAKTLSAFQLVAAVLVLMNLEKTFRAAVG